jgi:hypothetical protein
MATIIKLVKPALADGNDVDWLDEVIAKGQATAAPFRAVFGYEPPILEAAMNRRRKLEERVKLNAEMARLLPLDALDHYDSFVSAVRRADELRDLPGTAADTARENTVRQKLQDAAGGKIAPWATDVLFLLDRGQMELCLAEAQKAGFSNGDVEEIKNLLQLPEEKFVRMQLKRANEIGDKDRVMNREIRLKDLYLDMYGQQFEFSPSCPGLRDDTVWAHSKLGLFSVFVDKNALKANFLKHTVTPIHLSLTNLSEASGKEALKSFKNLMGFMGDRKYNCA